jgi:ATP-dependent Clp protease ATP-binding subunit ClpC
MVNLPISIGEFVYWWFIKAPSRLFTILKRVVILLNNEISFTLNIRLLFTPLFGDYTIPGRFIGFTFRMFEIFFGSILLLVLGVVTLLIPFIWWAVLPLSLYYLKLWTIPLVGLIFVVHYLSTSNTPLKRVKNVSRDRPQAAIRPKAKDNLKIIMRQKPEKLQRFLSEPDIQFILKKSELLREDFVVKLSKASSIKYQEITKTAYDYAAKHETRYIESEHLFLALLANTDKIESLLAAFSSDLESVEGAVRWVVFEREELSRIFFWQEDYIMPPPGGIGKGMTGRVTPFLDSISTDFTKHAKRGTALKVVGREKEIKEVAEMLNGSKANVLLIGEPGCGKTSIIRGIATKIVRGVEYENLKYKRLVGLETSALIAGARSVGEIADRINRAMDEIHKSGDIILFLDEIHALIGGTSAEGEEAANIFSILEPHLADHQIQFIGATNIENYRKYIEPNGSFTRLFETLEIPESSKEDTLEIIKFISKYFERDYKVLITFPALQKVIELSEKLMHERVLPDKAIQILNRTAGGVTNTTKYLTAEEIAKEISEVTHVPVSAITEQESEKLLNIENELKKKVIGQDEAIKQIGNALKRARVGIRNENKPIASFLFVGTTGVGKTETAKVLAKEYFGDEKAMIRLDMSEYQQIDSIDRLIGSPDGKSKGILTEAVRSRPFALILLDEIEKAYSNILLAFLQVLDDGRLTDSSGRVADFTNTIIIATSNIGTKAIQEISQRGGHFSEMQEAALSNVREKFAPEFLNRFNGIIVYRPLSMVSVKKIADLLLNSVRQIAEDKGIKVTFKDELIEELVKKGYSPEWGARPLRRAIEDTIESYLATKILAKEFKRGDAVELGMEVFEQER